MNRVEVLLRTPEVTLSVFDHPSDEARADPSSERASLDPEPDETRGRASAEAVA